MNDYQIWTFVITGLGVLVSIATALLTYRNLCEIRKQFFEQHRGNLIFYIDKSPNQNFHTLVLRNYGNAPGPVRSKSQVEISATDARTLGIKAPVRQSGDTAGSAPIALVGPKGAIYLDEGCIVAARHIHMCPEDAAAAGLKDNDFVSVRVGNERGVVLDQVKIRVDESFTTEMHIDTDEANASQVKQDDLATIIY